MRDITIRKQQLLEILQKNRAEHRAIFLKALEGYRQQAIQELEAMLTEAKQGKRIRRSVNLIEPMDQTRDYDRAIRIMELDARDAIVLDEHDFAQYVLDDWVWKDQFTSTNLSYLNK